MEVVHEVRVQVYPLHELLAGCSGRDVRTVELGKFALTVCAEFHDF